MSDAYAAILISVYLLAVIAQKKEDDLAALLRDETDFIYWAVSLGAVVLLCRLFGAPGAQFLSLVFVALIMTATTKNDKIINNITDFLRGK